MNAFTRIFVVAAVALLAFGCSGTPNSSSQTSGSSSSSSSTTTGYTIGGTVTGLTGSGLVLQDNLGDNLTITASGAFTFKTSIATGKTYSVTVLTQPTSPVQTCTVANGSGTASANVTNVGVTCSTNTASIGLAVTGLAGTGLVLQDNGGDNLTVNKNGSYTFATAIPVGSAYSVTVLTQPNTPAQICTVASGSGTANASVGNIVVTCSTPTISIGGSVTGLDGTGLVLQNNGGNNLTVTANGSFTFSNLIVSGGAYNVTVLTQPATPAQTCTVSGGSGTTTSNVITVQVLCPAVFFPVGGQVVGLVGTGGGMVLQNNGGDNLPLSGNGAFTFVTQIAYGGQYDVNLFVGPTTQPQGCVTWGYQGLVTGPVDTVLVDCGHNDWLWLNGSNTANATGSTTTPPTNPITALDTSAPGGRKYPATWVDNAGNLWLFGGIGYDIPTTPTPIFLNDMWVYTGTQSYYGGYPTYWNQVVANLSGAGPTPRWGAISWTDAAGTLWLFGGQEAGTGFVNDLWSFNTTSKTWTLVAPGGYNANGTYGTKGAAAGGNVPGGRWGATAQLDSFGNLWLFGGFGYDATSTTPGLLNDLWEYTGGKWVWISGAKVINQDGVYGTQGTASASNVPGGRQASASWIDSSGNFYVFGGYNLSPSGQPDAFNDLWKFSSGQWTWLSGSSTVNQTAVYGVQGTAAAANVPGARWSSASWIDAAGRLWLFGGEGYDTTADGTLGDLWQYSGGQWTWVKGPNSVSRPGVYGLTPGEVDYPHVINYPGTRWGAGYWVNLNGEFFMFGGEGYDSTTASGGIGMLNDLWRYLPFP
jgi:hypothetical protein